MQKCRGSLRILSIALPTAALTSSARRSLHGHSMALIDKPSVQHSGLGSSLSLKYS